MEPQISKNFFFSSESKIFQENQEIDKNYPSKDQNIYLIVPVGKLSIEDEKYIEIIKNLSKRIGKLKGIDSVMSLTLGPESIEDGINNPLWSRLLVTKDKKNSFIIISIEDKFRSGLITKIEAIRNQNSDYQLKIAGVPYFNEQMKRNISKDMKKFTITAIILCSIVLFLFFPSFKILFFSIVTCLTASAATLVGLSLYGKGIGILTANLLIIAYILSLSHYIFLTSNYNKVDFDPKKLKLVVKKTFISSSWCMLTTLLGFTSLIFVEAKPLQELGEGGVIAAISALVTVYFIYVPLMFFYNKKKKSKKRNIPPFVYRHSSVNTVIALVFIALGVTLGMVGISKVNTDPSLLDYFDKDGEIFKQLDYLNSNGGSNPLKFEIQLKSKRRLDEEDSYQKMWKLHKELEKHPQVGTIFSLPVLMDESNEHWLARILPWNIILDFLESDKFDSVAKNFVSEDRTRTLFTLRMIESKEKKVNRLEVTEILKNIINRNGFVVKRVGGTYYLQGELAKLVKDSLVKGVIFLCIVFTIIIFIISRNFYTSALVFVFSIVMVAILFGIFGIFKIPIDIISSPAINIALGIAVDSIIHITRDASRKNTHDIKSWHDALANQAYPALASMMIISIGFSCFIFSDFPPSFRFGLIVLLGIALSAPLSINIIPLSSKLGLRKKIECKLFWN